MVMNANSCISTTSRHVMRVRKSDWSAAIDGPHPSACLTCSLSQLIPSQLYLRLVLLLFPRLCLCAPPSLTAHRLCHGTASMRSITTGQLLAIPCTLRRLSQRKVLNPMSRQANTPLTPATPPLTWRPRVVQLRNRFPPIIRTHVGQASTCQWPQHPHSMVSVLCGSVFLVHMIHSTFRIL